MSVDYIDNDPRGFGGDPSRGAALGRPTIMDVPRHVTLTLLVSQVNIDSGGYDRNGAYFGTGTPLWWIRGEDSEGRTVDYVTREHTRDGAEANALAEYPCATIAAPPCDDPDYVSDVVDGYIEAALWSSMDDNERPMDDTYGPEDLTPEARAEMEQTCRDFLTTCAEQGVDLSELEAGQVGHDLWLTSNHHGAGFWDRGIEAGDALTKIAHDIGASYLYAIDGKVCIQ